MAVPKDYARLNLQTKKRKASFSFWRIMVLLLGIGILLAIAVFYVKRHHVAVAAQPEQPLAVVREAKPVDSEDQQQQAAPQLPDADTQAQQDAPSKITFDFYKMLPRMSVKTLSDQSEGTQTASAENNQYLLQIASFANIDDAKDFLAKLQDAHLQAKITPVFQNHAKWYRVQMGPYKDLSVAQKARDVLQENNISSILITQYP